MIYSIGEASNSMMREKYFSLRPGKKPCQLLVVDPRIAFHQAIKAACAQSREFHFLPPARSTEGAKKLIKRSHPELIIIGKISNPVASLITYLKLESTLRILMLHGCHDLNISKTILGGAIGFIDQEWTPSQVHKALKIARTMMVIPRIVATQIVHEIRGEHETRTLGPVLSTQQRRLSKLIAQGLNNKTMADQLGIEEKTVSNELIPLYAKLNVHKRQDAVQKLLDLGFNKPH